PGALCAEARVYRRRAAASAPATAAVARARCSRGARNQPRIAAAVPTTIAAARPGAGPAPARTAADTKAAATLVPSAVPSESLRVRPEVIVPWDSRGTS